VSAARTARAPKRASAPRAKRAGKPARERQGSGVLIALGAVGMAAGVALVGYLLRFASASGNAEHAAPDLALDQPRPDAQHRAPEAFRPDPTAPVPANERESLRPATLSQPALTG